MLDYYNPNVRVLLCRRCSAKWKRCYSFGDPFWRLYWHPNSGVEINCEGEVFKLSSDKIFLISPETKFGPNEKKTFEQFYIHFEADVPYDSCKPGVYEYPADDYVLDMIRALSETSIEYPNLNRGPALLALTICHIMLCKIPENLLSKNFTSKRIIQITKYMNNHFLENISNETLAGIVNMNKSSFARFFKSQTGISPQQYICERRIRRACVLLKYSEFTIDDIAEQTGFKDRYYFSRVFKKNRGISPGAFRRL